MGYNKNDDAYALIWAKKIKAINAKGGKCINCSENDIFKLVFHHTIAKEKEAGINTIRFARWSVIEKELDKCEVLCWNCHAELHQEEISVDHRRAVLKQKLLEYKDIFRCEKCNYKGVNSSSLNFHHVKNKSFEVSQEAWKSKKFKKGTFEIEDRVLKELDKCEVLCANCHQTIHRDKERFERLYPLIQSKLKNHKEYRKIDKEAVLALYTDGTRQIDIAKQLECNKSAICYLVKKYA